MNTTENNKIIAEFMKWDILNDMTYSKATKGKWIELDKLKFHSDWNWLMEVVEKIAPLISESEFKYRIGNDLLSVNKEGVYNACVEFIKWYNENGAKNN